MNGDKTIIKRFVDWIRVKIKLDMSVREQYFSEGEVWWVSIGQNIGTESNGKNDTFERPVLILKKFNKDSFWGVSISSNTKWGMYYFPITVSRGTYCINLSQLRTMSSKRLLRHIGNVSKTEFTTIKQRVSKLLV